jgi:hypothetical protein
VQTIVSDCTIGAASDIDEIVLRVEKYTGDASFDNNIVIYVNNTKNENYSVYNVAMSDMTDNENFTYLCFDSYSSNTSTSHKEQTCFLLTDISFSDYTAPVATLSSSLPKTAAIGDTILLPTVTITDNVDGTLTGKIRLYAPDGSTVDISSGSFTVTMEGRYQFIVKASDSSGNSLIEIYSLKVGDVSPVKEYTLSVQAETRSSGCQSSASGAPCLIVLAAVCLIKIKKQRKSKS